MKYGVNNKKNIKQGKGSGTLENYSPWLDNRSFPSRGRVTRIKGIKTGRMHTFFSDLELKYFYLLEWSSEVIDIREQFPLLDDEKTTKETAEIAYEKGIKHPINRRDNTLNVFTTDFLITKEIDNKEVTVARTLKYKKELEKPRTIELFEIERKYWENRGVEWGIVTEKDIPKVLVDNIKWLHKFADLEISKKQMGISDKDIIEILRIINKELHLEENREKKILDLIQILDSKYSLKNGTSLNLFKYAVFNKIIKINMMNEKINKNPYIFKILLKGE